MAEWLVVLLGLVGLAPEPRAEATVTPPIELAVPELAGAERQFVRFRDDATGVEVQRLVMRKETGFAIADYRDWSAGYALDDPWKRSPVFAIRADRRAGPSASGWNGDIEWRFFRASAESLDCIALRKPVRLRHDPGNIAEVVEADAVAVLCLRPGLLTERDVTRVSEALRINQPPQPGLLQVAPEIEQRYRLHPLLPRPRR